MRALTRVRRLVARRGLPRRFTPVIFAFYMALIMAFLMTLVITPLNEGMGPGFTGTVLRSYVLAMPVAFVCVMIVRPLVVRLVAWTIREGRVLIEVIEATDMQLDPMSIVSVSLPPAKRKILKKYATP